MMKKQIFTLLLSAAIFTTSPLFAMDSPPQPENEGKVSVHRFPVCRFENVDPIVGQGTLSTLPQDMKLSILADLPLKNLIICSQTSKAMSNFCEKPILWDRFLKEHTFAIRPNLCIIPQFARFQLRNSFSQWSIEAAEYKKGRDFVPYRVSLAALETFFETPCATTWWAYADEINNPEVKSYQFFIGDRQFEVHCSPRHQKHFPDLKELKRHVWFMPFMIGHGYENGKMRCILGTFSAFKDSVILKEVKKN